ncbi:unnamed protein product [Callosobruchus maculatus]|uniref:Cyclin-like domain-containing protein n=1 Tax=Callosobruchus maculatus TaxID=64391 RepID=A0A653DG08_CALMS|nr:unnamed protein product [Callosobruchus maculatus]
MFAASTQCKHWMFSNEEELNKLREAANTNHIQTYGKNIDAVAKYDFFLTPEEEKIMVKRFELHLRDFCKRFQPSMPRCVVGTAFHYFKRFYINNSVMNYHPKEIMVTCIYLACKVEEFNVSIQQFVANIKGDREKATDIILNNELLLMEQLNFHLSIHNPFRPVEGLLIDIKAVAKYDFFLTPEEEKIMVKRFELHLRDFCKRFQPSMPRCVVGTAFHYFKRFYINNSVMNYHPKEIMVTCIYLACKVEEFNVSIQQFVVCIHLFHEFISI